MIWYYSSTQGWLYKTIKTEILPIELDKREEFFQFHWPKEAIDRVNKLVIENKKSFKEACQIVSQSLVRN